MMLLRFRLQSFTDYVPQLDSFLLLFHFLKYFCCCCIKESVPLSIRGKWNGDFSDVLAFKSHTFPLLVSLFRSYGQLAKPSTTSMFATRFCDGARHYVQHLRSILPKGKIPAQPALNLPFSIMRATAWTVAMDM